MTGFGTCRILGEVLKEKIFSLQQGTFETSFFPQKLKETKAHFFVTLGRRKKCVFVSSLYDGEAKTGSLKTEYIRIDHNFLWSVQRCACKRASESIQTTFELRFKSFLGSAPSGRFGRHRDGMATLARIRLY